MKREKERTIVVYDFDKTLTYKDTLFGFFYAATQNRLQLIFKMPIYLCCMVLAKCKILDNTALKKIGVALFLKNLRKESVLEIGKRYVSSIHMNQLFYRAAFDDGRRYFIVSASFEEYLSFLFPPDVTVIGSRLSYRNGIVDTLAFNCYQDRKREALKEMGIDKIDILYTDSYSDVSLAQMAEKIVVVAGDKTTDIENIDAFKRYFGR